MRCRAQRDAIATTAEPRPVVVGVAGEAHQRRLSRTIPSRGATTAAANPARRHCSRLLASSRSAARSHGVVPGRSCGPR
jgi:hypothetical protein